MANRRTQIFSRETPYGGVPERNPNRKLSLNAKDFQDASESVPIPLAYGTARTSGITITPIFQLKSTGSDQGK